MQRRPDESAVQFIERRMRERLEEARRRQDVHYRPNLQQSAVVSETASSTQSSSHSTATASPKNVLVVEETKRSTEVRTSEDICRKLDLSSVVASDPELGVEIQEEATQTDATLMTVPLNRSSQLSLSPPQQPSEKPTGVWMSTIKKASSSVPVRPAPPSPNVTTDVSSSSSRSELQQIHHFREPRKPLDHEHERSFWIYVWPALFRHCRPAKLLVDARCKYFQNVLEKAAKETNCSPSPCYLYTPTGDRVYDVSRLCKGSHYIICPSAVRYSEDMVPQALLLRLVDEARLALYTKR